MSKVIAIAKVLIKFAPVFIAAWAAYQQIRKATAPSPPLPTASANPANS